MGPVKQAQQRLLDPILWDQPEPVMKNQNDGFSLSSLSPCFDHLIPLKFTPLVQLQKSFVKLVPESS